MSYIIPLDCLYEGAFQRFTPDTGTFYPSTTQSDLDFHRASVFHHQNKGPFTSALTATEELMHHNSPKRVPPSAEQAAIARLQDLALRLKAGSAYSADVPIKTFSDLDLVFFGGHLGHNVCVNWSSDTHDPRICRPTLHDKTKWPKGDFVLGVTRCGDFNEHGQCRITLNAKTIFSESYWPLRRMLGTMLHELCHAYHCVRCPNAEQEGGDGMGHDHHFETRFTVVHRRALQMWGRLAIDGRNDYLQRHFLEEDGEWGRCESGLKSGASSWRAVRGRRNTV